MGGLERVQVTLANALVTRGHDITIKVLDNQFDLLPLLDKRVKFEHISYRRFPLLQNMKFIWTLFDDGCWEKRATPKQLYKYYVMHEKYDVEIAFFRGLPVKIISGSANKNVKKIAWVHSDSQLCEGMISSYKNLKDTIRAYRRFDKIVCVSKEAQKKFETKMGIKENVITIYNITGIEDIIKKANDDKEIERKSQFSIVTVGRLANNAKGFDRLLEVCKRLNEEKIEYTLTIIGDGLDREKLQNFICENNLNNVYMAGMQENPYKFMKHADLLVCSSYYEGYNLTVAESLIIGTPVLSTNCTGPCEILDNGEYGMIVENSAEGLYQGIKKIITDKELYNHYKGKAKERRPFFDEEKIINEVENLFK
jgi:glycosyltransferase involved in cell wall biosynthesis